MKLWKNVGWSWYKRGLEKTRLFPFPFLNDTDKWQCNFAARAEKIETGFTFASFLPPLSLTCHALMKKKKLRINHASLFSNVLQGKIRSDKRSLRAECLLKEYKIDFLCVNIFTDKYWKRCKKLTFLKNNHWQMLN